MPVVYEAVLLIVVSIIVDACLLAWKLKGENDSVIRKEALNRFGNGVVDALVLVPICAYFFTH